MSETTHISETVSAGQLRAFIERIERVEEEIKTLNGDKSEIYKELRGCGFDVKAVRQCVAARKLDSVEREERNAIFDLYWAALTGASRVHVHEGRDDAGSSSGRIAEFDSADAGSNPAPVTIDAETGEITEQEQPETQSSVESRERQTVGVQAQGSVDSPISKPEATPMDEARKGPSGTAAEIPPSAVPAVEPEADNPSPPPASGAHSKRINPDCRKAARGEQCALMHSQALCSKCRQAVFDRKVAT